MAAENAKAGTTGWRLRRTRGHGSIEGYANAVSVLPGQSFTLYVSTSAPSFTVTAYRVGYYHGTGARQVWRSPPVVGRTQPAATLRRPLNTVTTAWSPSLRVAATGWPPGDYLLTLDASTGARRYVPITVRSPDLRGRVVILAGVTTWQAYNLWGGYDLYRGPTGYADRSRAVSFDRPYDGNGAELFLAYERPLVVEAEELGLNLGYLTDVDLAREPGILAGATALVVLSHDEYWSRSERRAATRARSTGTNIAFLGADAAYRHIRLAATRLGPDRLEICYKDLTDPLYGVDDADVTVAWRLPPDPRPESTLTGAMYACYPADAAFVVADPKSWIYAGTGVRAGSAFAHLVGIEYDAVIPGAPLPPGPLQILARSPLRCGQRAGAQNATYYTVASGAGVFDAGTLDWACALDRCHGVTAAGAAFVRRVTANVLRAFAAGPAGRRHPAGTPGS